MSVDVMESLDQHIGRTVHGILWERRITQRRLAAHLGLDETMVSKMLRGTRSWSIAELLRTGEFLGVPVAELLPVGTWAPRGSNPQPTGFSVQLDLFGGDEEDHPLIEAGFPFPSPRRPLMAIAA